MSEHHDDRDEPRVPPPKPERPDRDERGDEGTKQAPSAGDELAESGGSLAGDSDEPDA